MWCVYRFVHVCLCKEDEHDISFSALSFPHFVHLRQGFLLMYHEVSWLSQSGWTANSSHPLVSVPRAMATLHVVNLGFSVGIWHSNLGPNICTRAFFPTNHTLSSYSAVFLSFINSPSKRRKTNSFITNVKHCFPQKIPLVYLNSKHDCIPRD